MDNLDVNKLVNAIAQEVLKQLNGKGEKPCVMILAARDGKVVSKVKAHLDEDVDFLFFMEPTNGRTPSRYILPQLCCASMADLALGRASGSLMTEVLRLLLSGIEIETLEFGYKAYAETAPGPLLRLYESYAKSLAGYGLKEFRRKRLDTVRFFENLVTEKDVVAAKEKGASALMVPATVVVTPLAAEAAKNMHINILKQL